MRRGGLEIQSLPLFDGNWAVIGKKYRALKKDVQPCVLQSIQAATPHAQHFLLLITT